jgi:hypothetical protein
MRHSWLAVAPKNVSLFVHVLVEFFHTKKESIAAINSLMLSSKPRTRDFIGINWAGYRGN